ncbi:hypothetical protein, partial [Sansalvadorimonas verongulae]|uniref:hypothetical protein n=1 Tax=Sansalvadorimonas verongulae TaxID=2172824 RepID=UPI001E6492BD
CFRLVSVWPKFMLRTLGIEENKKHEFKQKADSLFALANNLEPHRHELKKDEPWRFQERELLMRFSACQY